MPLGDEQSSWTVGNPFEEPRQRIPVYSAQEIATLQSKLERQLGPEYISSRAGPGGKKVHYLASEKCINLANEVFGFNGWSSSIRDVQVDFVDENTSTGKISMGLSVVVRVTLKDGAYHEDLGYGHIENCKDKAGAFEKAKKEAVSDARKRALRNFGNVLGNCIYDKDYLAKVTKVKAEPMKFNADNLHRQSGHITVRKEPTAQLSSVKASKSTDRSDSLDADDEFGGVDFDEADFSVATTDHPDEIELDTSKSLSRNGSSTRLTGNAPLQAPGGPPHQGSNQAQGRLPPPVPNIASTNTNRAPAGYQAPSMRGAQLGNGGPQRPPQGPNAPVPQNRQFVQTNQHQQSNSSVSGQNSSSPPVRAPLNPNEIHPQTGELESPAPAGPPARFFTARAAETLQDGNKPLPDTAAFNPRLESPSIRKTAGFDHSSSKHTTKESVGALAANLNGMPQSRGNFVNPHLDPSRKVGMPGGMGSPLQNRSSFRQPQMKRPALNEVTANTMNIALDGSADLKRHKTGEMQGNVGTVIKQE